MTNLQLYQQISALPSHLKQDVINYIKTITGSSKSNGISNYKPTNYFPTSYLTEPEVNYNNKKPFLDLLLNGPTFTEKQLKKITDSRSL